MPELMKGKVWADHKHKLKYPVIVEEKVDEIRLHVKYHDGGIEYLSYDGKPLYNLERFTPNFLRLLDEQGLTELDLGFEVAHDFTASKRWVRSSTGLPADLAGVYHRFILFDAPDWTMLPYESRRRALYEVNEAARALGLNFVRPRYMVAECEDDVAKAYAYFREDGCEGVMVKTLDHKYIKGKRIDGWLKWKPSLDADGIIEALHEAVCGKDQPEKNLREGDLLGRVGSVTLRLADGSTATPHGIPHELGVEMLTYPKKFIGEKAEFKYMMRDTQGGYRHCTFHRLRE